MALRFCAFSSIEKVRLWLIPRNNCKLQSVLEFVSFVRKCIRTYTQPTSTFSDILNGFLHKCHVSSMEWPTRGIIQQAHRVAWMKLTFLTSQKYNLIFADHLRGRYLNDNYFQTTGQKPNLV